MCSRSGQQTLLVDLDQQGNATVALGLDRETSPSSYDCLVGEATVAEAARPAGPDNLWIVPASRDLAGASVELPRIEGSERRLRDRLGPVRERFAYTLLDCPPSLGPVTVNALVAADRVLVPVQAEYLALEGLVQFLDTLKPDPPRAQPGSDGQRPGDHDARRAHPPRPRRRARAARALPDLVLTTVIPRSVRLAEAPSFGLPIREHAPSSVGSKAYLALAEEVVARG